MVNLIYEVIPFKGTVLTMPIEWKQQLKTACVGAWLFMSQKPGLNFL